MQHLKIHKIYIIQWKVCFFIYQSPPRVNKKYDKTQIKGLYTDGILTFRGFIAQNEVLHFAFSVQFKFLWSSQSGKTEVKLLPDLTDITPFQCIGTPADFAARLEEMLADWSHTPSEPCPGARISTRTQVLPTTWTDPESLRSIF